MNKKYENIIHLPRPVWPDRPRLSQQQRAAQFAPFAALTGYEAVLAETARQTEPERCLDEEQVAAINRVLEQLKSRVAQRPAVCVKCFVPDERKAGGSYRMLSGKVIKIDEFLQKILLENGENIEFGNIIHIIAE